MTVSDENCFFVAGIVLFTFLYYNHSILPDIQSLQSILLRAEDRTTSTPHFKLGWF